MSSTERLLVLASFPAVMLAVGLGLFYSQMAFGWWIDGTWTATSLSICCALVLAIGVWIFGRVAKTLLKEVRSELIEAGFDWPTRAAIVGALLALLAVMTVSALKPAHRFVEGDFIEYHLFLPLQAWLRGSWRGIDWHAAEFLNLTLDYALSPFWISLPLLNRVPQVLIQGFLILQIVLGFRFLNVPRPHVCGVLAAMSFVAFRTVVIQLGNGMMDLVNVYFGLGALVVLAAIAGSRRSLTLSVLFGLNVGAYAAHKSFGMAYVAVLAVAIDLLLRRLYGSALLVALKRVHWVAIPAAACVVVPTLVRNYYYTGDPFYPVLVSVLPANCDPTLFEVRTCDDLYNGAAWNNLNARRPGWGYTLRGFLTAPFLVAFPEPVLDWRAFFGIHANQQNRGDYPAGLFWFFTWGALLAGVTKSASAEARRVVLFIFGLAVALYLLWWTTGQQGRWLYPVCLALAAHWGYMIAMHDRKRTTRALLPALALWVTIVGTAVSAAKVLGLQLSTLGCFGESCLTYQRGYSFGADLYGDYHGACPPTGELALSGRHHLGYLRCPVVLPRSDFPWMKPGW